MSEPFVLPGELTVLPLWRTVIYPHTVIPLAIAQPDAVALLDDPGGAPQLVGMVALRGGDRRPDPPGAADCYTVGTAALVHRLLRLPDNTLRVAVQGLERFRIDAWITDAATSPVLRARVSAIHEPPGPVAAPELLASLRELVQNLARRMPNFSQELLNQIVAEHDPERLSYLTAAATLPLHAVADCQLLLETPASAARLQWLHDELSRNQPQWALPQLTITGSMDKQAPAELAAKQASPGVVRWLCKGTSGPAVVEIDVLAMPGSGRLTISGTHHQQVADSAAIALSWVRANAASLQLAVDFYAHTDLHIHIPPGAAEDDLASMALPLAVALVAVLSGRSVAPALALTGGLRLNGQTLPVAHAADLLPATRTSGIQTLVLPTTTAATCSAPDLAIVPVTHAGQAIAAALNP